MKITTKAEYIWSTFQRRYILVRDSSIIWTGSVCLTKGASSQQTALADSQTAFYNQMTSDYNTQFANQNAILGTLTNSLNPIISAGANQFGYSTAQTNALNSQAVQGTGQEYAKANTALKANQAAQGGGNAVLPSGVASQQQSNLASSAANQASNQLLGIQNAGYAQGHQDYENAIGQMDSVAGMYNPNGVATSANSAGSSADSEANAVAQANAAASPWNMVGSIAGGALSSGLNAFTGGIGTSLGKSAGSAMGGA